MTVQAVSVLAALRTPRLVRAHRLAIATLGAISIAFTAADLAGMTRVGLYDETLGALRWDLPVELLARLLMVGLAVFCAAVTRGSRDTRLLMWALVLSSFDVFWQTSYGHGGIEWAAMAVKYTGVPAGLMCLMRFCANFGEGDLRAARTTIYNAAPYAAAVLAAIGLSRGITHIQNCEMYHNGWVCLQNGPLVVGTYNAYIAGDVALRLACIAAAAIGVFCSAKKMRLQLALVALTCILLALGTVLDFTARFTPAAGGVQASFIYADALTVLFFPAGLTIALFARQLFDVDVDPVLRRVLALTVATAAALLIFALSHALLHRFALVHLIGYAAGVRPDLGTWLTHHEWAPDAIVGALLLMFFRLLEEPTLRFIDDFVLPDRKQRLERLRDIGERLFAFQELRELDEYNVARKVRAAAGCVFVDVFLGDGNGRYYPRPDMYTDAVRPHAIAAADPIVAQYLSKGARASLRQRTEWANADVAFPMLVGKQLYGFLACGRKYHPTLDGVYDAFDSQELHELEVLARQLGMVLHGLGATL